MAEKSFKPEEVFSLVQQKAYKSGVFPFDSTLYRLASYITGGKHEAYYLGKGKLEIFKGGEPFLTKFILLQWEEDETERSAIALRVEYKDQDPNYSFYVLQEVDEKPIVDVVHSTDFPPDDERFKKEMGSEILRDPVIEKRVGYEILKYAMMAEI